MPAGRDGEMQRERTALVRFAVNPDEASVATHRVIDDGESEPRTLRTSAEPAVDAIELAENPLLLAA